MASERLHISQPSISTAITILEQELETQLFVRHPTKGLSLTPPGRLLLTEAKQLVDQVEQIYTVASDVHEKVRGQLALGCLVVLASMIMQELSHSFTAAFPAARILHTVSHHRDLLEKLQSAEIDVALSYDLRIPEGFEFVPLVRLPPHILVGQSHPLAQRTSISLQELINEPLILLDLPLSREYFLALFAKQGLQPRISTRSMHQDVIRTMVANGYGYTIANVRPRAQIAMDGRPVVPILISGEHRQLNIGVISLQRPKKSRLLAMFEQHCRSVVSDSYIPGMVAPVMGRRRIST